MHLLHAGLNMAQTHEYRNSPMRWRLIGLFVVAGILLIPIVSMLLSSKVVWGLEDFVAAAVLLTWTWLGVEVVARLAPPGAWRALAICVIKASALIMWAHLAVGVW
jgi:hypothetical protein